MEKVCSECKLSKPAAEFYSAAGYRDGLKGQCKSCCLAANKRWAAANPDKRRAIGQAAYRRKAAKDPGWYSRKNLRFRALKLGLTLEQAEAALCLPCQICGRSDQPRLDHDHETGEFRGTLCNNCNLMLGHAHDDQGILRSALAYLDRALCPVPTT